MAGIKIWQVILLILLVPLVFFFKGDLFSLVGGNWSDGYIPMGTSTLKFTDLKCWESQEMGDGKYKNEQWVYCDSKYWTFIYPKYSSWKGAGDTGSVKATLSGSDNDIKYNLDFSGTYSQCAIATSKESFNDMFLRFDLIDALNKDPAGTGKFSSGYNFVFVENPFIDFTQDAWMALNLTGDVGAKKEPICTPSNQVITKCDRSSYIGSDKCINKKPGFDVNGCPTLTYDVYSCKKVYVGAAGWKTQCTTTKTTVGGTIGFKDVLTTTPPTGVITSYPTIKGTDANMILKDAGLIDIIPSLINSGVSEIRYKGAPISSMNSGHARLLFCGKAEGGYSLDPKLEAYNIRYKVMFSCKLDRNDMLIAETFGPGMNISRENLRFPSKAFCNDNPAVVTSESGSTTNEEIYQLLATGKSYKVPSTQTWTIFYSIDNTNGLVPTTCSVEQAYNVNLGQCYDLPGIATVCSVGIFDPARGTCTIAPSVVCPVDSVYDGTNCVMNTTIIPQTQIDCPAGSTYSGGKCVITPELETLCEQGRFDLSINKCVYNPPVEEKCERGTYNPTTGVCEITYVVESRCSDPSAVWDPNAAACIYPSEKITSSETLPQEGFAAKQFDQLRSASWWPAALLMFIIVVLALIFTQTGQKVYERGQNRVVIFIKSNIEGFVLGGLFGALAAYSYYTHLPFLYWFGYPFSLLFGTAMGTQFIGYLVSIIFYSIIGTVIDRLWDKKN